MNSWKIYALASAFFAALTAILAKAGLPHISSSAAAFLRAVIMMIILLVFLAMRHENFPSLYSKHVWILLLSGAAGAISWLCYFQALQTGPVSLVSALDKFSLVFTILLSVIFLRENLNAFGWLGLFLVTAGSFLIAFR